MASERRFVTRDELAEILRCSTDTIDRHVHDRRDPMPHLRVGRRIVFDVERVLQHLDKLADGKQRRKPR